MKSLQHKTCNTIAAMTAARPPQLGLKLGMPTEHHPPNMVLAGFTASVLLPISAKKPDDD